jgi:hypothetical protein
VCSKQYRRSLQAELTPAGEGMPEEMHDVCSAELERRPWHPDRKEAETVTAALEKVTASTPEHASALARAA